MTAPSGIDSSRPRTSSGPPRWRARRWFLSGGVLLALAAIGAVVIVLVVPPWLSDYAQRELSRRTSRHFDGDVSVASLDVSVFPRLRIDGTGLELRKHDHPNDPPLITIQRFSALTNLMGLRRGHVDRVEVDGLEIYVPPDAKEATASSDAAPAADIEDRRGAGERDGENDQLAGGLLISEIVSTNAVLTIAPDDADGTPQVFDIRHVRLTDFGLDRPAVYQADLVNPRPRGPIVSSGRFGPWNRREPRLTPLSGDYTMNKADMAVFKGIGGTLTSVGRFSGVLESIDVTGTSTMPDFSVDVGQHPMRLDTSFDARVDGTNGNTYLNRVEATLGESHLVAKGEVAGTPGVDGKRIVLDVTSEAGRLEDFIYLVVNEPVSPLSGRIRLETKLDLPPGERPVPERIQLDGRFTISQGQFAQAVVQDKVDELSRRGQGRPKAMGIEDVVSTFSGQFAMREGVLRLPRLGFRVSGAEVRLGGQYTLRSAALAFNGHLRLTAPLSKTVTGFRSWLLKPVDPFFRKNGAGAVVPIKLGGTAQKPTFGIDLKGL